MSLIPSWAHHYDEFWSAIRRRNLWLIKLRYGAVLMLLGFILSAKFILGFALSETQSAAFLLITFSILTYNVILHILRRFIKDDPEKFNPLHLSLLQMALDLTALLAFIYYTGGVETPLFMLFVFHMIVGSLILPGAVVYTMAALVVLNFSALVFAEYFLIIPHHHIEGLLNFHTYNNLDYVITTLTIFTFVIFISVLLANSIAKQLYKMEQDLLATIDKLRTIEEEKQKYIMGVVHEIKSPISAVHSYLDVILQKILGPLDEKIEKKLLRTRVRAHEAITLINNVLKISRLRLLDEISHEAVDIGEILNHIVRKQNVNIRNKNIRLEFNDRRVEKKKMLGDKFLLEIAFSNLINNSIKYTPKEGEIYIIISEKDDLILTEICDNGIGIPAKDIESIFKDFYRGSNIKQKGYEGTGLGLSIVKQVIDKHNGRISVESPSRLESSDNPGTSFSVTLPVYS